MLPEEHYASVCLSTLYYTCCHIKTCSNHILLADSNIFCLYCSHFSKCYLHFGLRYVPAASSRTVIPPPQARWLEVTSTMWVCDVLLFTPLQTCELQLQQGVSALSLSTRLSDIVVCFSRAFLRLVVEASSARAARPRPVAWAPATWSGRPEESTDSYGQPI